VGLRPKREVRCKYLVEADLVWLDAADSVNSTVTSLYGLKAQLMEPNLRFGPLLGEDSDTDTADDRMPLRTGGECGLDDVDIACVSAVDFQS
jgi:hypothetical protein